MSLRDDLRDQFVDGDWRDASSAPSIDWRGLGLGVVGSVILASIVGLSNAILDAGAWIGGAFVAVGTWVNGLVVSIAAIGADGMGVAAESWASFVGVFGVAALPVSVGVAVVMIIIIAGVVSRV